MFGLNPIEALEAAARNGLGLFGADGEEEQENESLGDEDSNEEDGSAEGDEDSGDEDGDESEGSDSTDVEGIRAAKERALKQKAAYKAKLKVAEKRIQELEGDDSRPDPERLAEAETTISTQSAEIQSLRLENAFLLDNTHNWHDPRLALSLIDTEEIEIEDDGEVVGLKEALSALAKKHPYLVKTDEKKPTPKPSGDPSRKKDDKAQKTARRQKLKGKYNI